MRKKIAYLFLFALLLISIVWLLLPPKLFNNDYAIVLFDENNQLLDARVSKDGQWRFPPYDTQIAEKYETCLLHFEDKRFYRHKGVDWLAIGRAFRQNIQEKKIISGGSTISMQVIRLARNNRKRSYFEKLIEIFLAHKLEFHYSKQEILKLYQSNAPYGGNMVGINSASYRYFGQSPENLTWAESALLAVLPNAPASIHLNKNREMLKNKRNRLLHLLFEKQIINRQDYELAVEEEIPESLRPFPHEAPHLLNRLFNETPEQNAFYTYLSRDIQNQAFQIIEQHSENFRKNGIQNAACIIAETRTGNVKAYIGNTGIYQNKGEWTFVDIASSPRSSGSILKPFLYTASLSKGEYLPHTLINDIPINYGNFSPQNYQMDYDGAVPASEAIIRSLNVPAVNMLEKHGVQVFLDELKELRINSINRSAEDYGLSLILGGAETRLDELCAAYASLGRRLLHYTEFDAQYFKSDLNHLCFIEGDSIHRSHPEQHANFSASGIWFCFEAMKALTRPEGNINWEYFSSDQPIAWKTGTSYGFRDAWAIGVTPNYTVAIWVGNADGEGRPNLVGIKTAAPVLFDIFKILPKYEQWFQTPWDDMIQMPVCQASGFLKNEYCTQVDSAWIPKSGYHSEQCPYHTPILLDENHQFLVNSSCYPKEKIQTEVRFILPPAIAYYYKIKHPDYKGLPPSYLGCTNSSINPIQIIYPAHHMKIFLPVDLDQKQQSLVFHAAHQDSKKKIFWHIDNEYIGTTIGKHQIAYQPEPGKHTILLVDEQGDTKSVQFEILSKKE
jgi:penicillin-binding protein 1C